MASTKVRPQVFFGNKESVNSASRAGQVELPSADFKDELPLLVDGKSDFHNTEIYTTVTLRIPQTLHNEYAQVALSQGMSVEEVMQHRLDKCKSYNSLRGLWFSDSEHSQLEKLLKKAPLETASQALTLLSQAGVVDLDGFKLALTIPQRKVLGIRTRYGTSPQQVFEAMVRKEFQV